MKKTNKLLSTLILTSALLTGLVACGPTSSEDPSNDPSTTNPSVVDVSSIEVTADKTTLIVGDTVNLSINVLPSNATNKNVTYSATGTVEVSSSGTVTAISVGTGSVTVTSVSNPTVSNTINFVVKDANDKSNLPFNEFIEELESTPYSVPTLSGESKFGLNNPSNVGVVEENVVELYPMIADDLADSIINVDSITDSQIASTVTGDTTANDYNKIRTAFALAKANGENDKITKILFTENKVYKVDFSEFNPNTSNVAFILDGLKNTYIDGNNATIVLTGTDFNFSSYFQVTNSTNVLFHSLYLDMEDVPSISGTVTGANVNDKTITIQVNEEFNSVIESAMAKSKQPKIRSWVEFNYQTKAPLQGGNFIVDGISSYSINKEGDVYSLTATFSQAIARPRNGTHIALGFSQYDARGIAVSSSTDFSIENLTMYHAAGMGLVADNVTNLLVNRFNLKVKENSEQLMTATADAMHFVSSHGNVKVTNSLIENSHDDALNIKHGYWYKLADAEGGTAKSMTVTRITSSIPTPKVGDKLAVYDEMTFEGHNPTQGYYTIKTIEETSAGFKLTVNERMANVGEWGKCRVTFMSDTPTFEFTNNIVRNKRNRGILVQVPDAIVQNNTFMNVGHGSIQAASAMDIYNEATMPQGITIKNNKFINNCYIKPEPLYGDISIFAISNNATVAPAGTLSGITIENNFVAKNGNSAVSLRGVGGDTFIKDNLFNECSQSQPSGDGFNTVFHFYNVADVELNGNYNHYTLGNEQSGIMTEGKTVESGITLVNNTNINFFVNKDAGPIVNIPKATGSINIDGKVNEWEDAGASDVEIIGISDAEGNERTADELKDHFAVKELYLTYNDTGIYIGFDIKDDYIDVKTVNDFWLGDCVEIFMSSVIDMPNADMQVYKDDGGALQAAFASRWETSNYMAISDVRSNSKYVQNKSLIQAKVVLTEDGYSGEILIPFTLAPEFKEAIDLGNPIDMAIVIADAERTNLGLKRVQMANVPHFVESYKTKTARMPQYIFN